MKKTIFLTPALLMIFISFQTDSSYNEGKTLFNNNCTPCHNLYALQVGPSLKDVVLKRDSAWLMKWSRSPQKLIKSGDSIANNIFVQFNHIIEPDLHLTDKELVKIYYYLKTEIKNKHF